MHPYFQKKTTNKLFFAIPFQISRATVVAGLVVVAQTGVLGPLGSLLANIVVRYGRTRLFFNGIEWFFIPIVWDFIVSHLISDLAQLPARMNYSLQPGERTCISTFD